MTTVTSTRPGARPNALLAVVFALAIGASFLAGLWATTIARPADQAVASAPTPTFDAVQFRADERDLR
jgi:hypothetical protein